MFFGPVGHLKMFVVIAAALMTVCLADDGPVDYFSGGSNWSDVCSNGTDQSPIHLENPTLAESFPALQTNYVAIQNPEVGFSPKFGNF